MSRSASKSLFAIILAICFVFSHVTAFASDDAETYNAKVADKVKELEQKYGINIRYPLTSPYVGIGAGTLATFEGSLENITPEIVRVISDWTLKKTGNRLTFEFTYKPSFDAVNLSVPAAYTPDLALIELLVPTPNGNSPLTGCSPIAITHEVGHAFYGYIKDRQPNMPEQWIKLSSIPHGGRFRSDVFASEYAATDPEEDFCETFAFSFVCNRPGLSLSDNLRNEAGESTSLGKKFNAIRNLVKAHIPDAEQALENLSRSRTAPMNKNWNGLRISGTSLEFMGYTAPYNVLKPLLASLGLTAREDPKWDSSIGGWTLTSTDGSRHLVFPGGGNIKLN